MPLDYKISEIKELRFEIKTSRDSEWTPEDLILDIGYKTDVEVAQDSVSYFFHCLYGFKKKGAKKAVELLHTDITITFDVKNLIKYVDSKIALNSQMNNKLLGIVVSTVGGIVYARTKGEKLNEYFIPILTPKELVNLNIPDHHVL